MKIIKRNGAEVVFDIDKIIMAVTKANDAVDEKVRMTPLQIERISQSVQIACEEMGRSPSVEEIQDLVEKAIMAHGAFEVAKHYITYRYTRSLVRKSNTTDDKILSLIECRWIDGWPMLGDENGHVPLTMEKEIYPTENTKGILGSDDFNGEKLSLYWQWNHNPVDDKWSLTERPGYLRLETSRVVDNLYLAPNTITQRMEGPKCKATVSLDISNMKDGDVAGFSAFNGHSGLLSVVKEGDAKRLVMSTNVVNFDNTPNKAIASVDVEEKEQVELNQNIIYLRIEGDFTPKRDIATFYYSLDNKEWKKIGTDFKMRFDYTKLFMGSKFAIFNYATKSLGGYVDVDYFDYERANDRVTINK